ncbi:hypothetical protein AYR56_09945 [Loigolactobacillus backii]|uniref:Glycosyltransferase 2-like domain-containing protein n=1 Tax=Loigolactobacillus backii TaxID=375175 RepID=A0A192H3L4_9LACO|nr:MULTISPECIES: glycosyltransferase family 2 protein [Loigolactobacillus]ANK62546.1 hypothetical protein AYR53_07055 [Loigolactobacillus backii]ANK70443.1 hypothetical protein AYR56_09945 [Loigolactobacillus backii]
MKVAALVVTYNKLDLLKECLQALFNQTHPLNHIIVIDNASEQTTQDYLTVLSQQGRINYVRLPRNIGGAGGFNAGLKTFIKHTQDDFAWIMDDDTIPTKTALEKMLSKTDKLTHLGFLCSNVKWTNGEPSAMNIPTLAKNWTGALDEDVVAVKAASFVSCMVARTAVIKVGYPITDFFIWGDDVEYTNRVSKYFNCYLVNKSVVIHKMAENKSVNIALENNPKRIARYYYSFRNRHFTARHKGFETSAYEFLFVLNSVRRVLFGKNSHRLMKLKVIFKGTMAGLSFNPKIEQVDLSDLKD